MEKLAESGGMSVEGPQEQEATPQAEAVGAVVETGTSGPLGNVGDRADAQGPVPPTIGIQGIESRFLYVDVAAQRAKQLRRGALPRLDDVAPVPAPDSAAPGPKFERVAMREVDAGKIQYELPDDEPAPAD